MVWDGFCLSSGEERRREPVGEGEVQVDSWQRPSRTGEWLPVRSKIQGREGEATQ